MSVVRCLAAFSLVIMSLAATAESVVPSAMYGLGEVHERIVTGPNDKQYNIFVRLPTEMKENASKLPTLYVLDAGVMFPVIAGYYQFMQLAQEVPDMIIVGIGYPSPDWQQGNNRSVDYTMPSAERDFWGGAPVFLDFLKGQVAAIERDYPADPNQRILMGRSIGGQFTIHAAFNSDLFQYAIASNPALHRNLPLFLKQPGDKTAQKLFVSIGLDDDGFRDPALKWQSHWEANKLPFALNVVHLEGHNHFSTPTASFRRGINWLLPEVPAATN